LVAVAGRGKVPQVVIMSPAYGEELEAGAAIEIEADDRAALQKSDSCS